MSHQIIACIDGSISTTAICDWASWAFFKLQIPLTLLHTLENTSKVTFSNLTGTIGVGSCEQLMEELSSLDEQRNKVALQHGKYLLDDAYQRIIADGIKEARSIQKHGSLLDTLLELEHEAKLVVIGRQGEHSEAAQSSQIGSQLETVARALHCPILVASPDFKAPKNILLAFDASPTSTKIITRIINNEHLLEGMKCHLVMVNNDSHEGELLEARKKLENVGLNVVVDRLEGEVEFELINYTDQHSIDLIIMGAFSHSKIRQFFVGSTTSHMLHATKIPILLLR
ncbi:MAG: universal stress protein [Legionellaceae bacterium]|nr:universal stress protein [Legionellaceae bacterium]